MSNNRTIKEDKVSAIASEISDAGLVVVVEQIGLNAEQTLSLRRAMREAGVSLKVVKNTLVKLAIKGTELEGLGEYLTGPTALAYSADPVAAAKVAAEFAKEKAHKDKFKIIGAAMDGKILDQAAAMTLATMPSLDESRGKLVGLIMAPATKIAGVLAAPAGQLARVISAKSKLAA